MKKFFTLFMMMFVGLTVWATDITITPADFEPAENSDYSVTKDGITVTVVGSTVTKEQMRIFKNKTITISSTVGNITKIVFTCTANDDAKYGPGSFNEQDGYTYEDKVGTWTGSAEEVVFTAEKNQVRATEIVVTVGGDVDARTATSIEFAEGYAERATCGKDEKISLPTATVKAGDAAVSGANVAWSLSSDTLAQLDGNDIKILNGVQGTVTVKADYAGDASYKPSSKSYTLTIYKGYLVLSSLIEDVTSSNPKWDNGGEYASYWFVNENFASVPNTVTFASGKYIYLTDGTNNLLFYGENSKNLKQGDVISGDLGEGQLGAVWGKLYRYNKLPEFSFTELNVKVESEGADVTPTTITVDQLSANINAYVKIVNAEFVSADDKKNISFKVGDATLAAYNQFGVDIEALEAGAKYTVVGMGSVYRDNAQLYLISFEKEDPTGISNVKTAIQQGVYYNLNGQRVENARKGIFIMNGKKVIK